MKQKRRPIRPKTPNIFSIRLSNSSLERLNFLHESLMFDNRNATLNHVIQNYYLYQLYSPLIEAMQDLFREQLRIIQARKK